MRLLPSLILATKTHNTIDELVTDIGSVLSSKFNANVKRS